MNKERDIIAIYILRWCGNILMWCFWENCAGNRTSFYQDLHCTWWEKCLQSWLEDSDQQILLDIIIFRHVEIPIGNVQIYRSKDEGDVTIKHLTFAYFELDNWSNSTN